MINEINILGVTFMIEEVECVSKEELRKGEINYLTGEIKLDRSMPKTMKEQVLMHEILHAVFDLLGYDKLAADEKKGARHCHCPAPGADITGYFFFLDGV